MKVYLLDKRIWSDSAHASFMIAYLLFPSDGFIQKGVRCAISFSCPFPAEKRTRRPFSPFRMKGDLDGILEVFDRPGQYQGPMRASGPNDL